MVNENSYDRDIKNTKILGTFCFSFSIRCQSSCNNDAMSPAARICDTLSPPPPPKRL